MKKLTLLEENGPRAGQSYELESGELEWGRSLFRVLGRLPVRFRARRDGARAAS